MKVHIAFPFSEGPSGGGNRFLLALREELRAFGVYTEQIDEAQAVFFNSHHFSVRDGIFDALIAAKGRSVDPPVLIHRVDGPISVVRGNAADHLADQSIALFNGMLADATVFQSLWSASVCRRMGLGTGQPTTVISNAPEARYFHPPSVRQARTGQLRIIATSWSSNWRKGFDIYRWLDSHLDPARFRMTFVGNSPFRFKCIEHLTAIDSARLGEVLRAHDVYITASVDDPCSNALIEAMACGLVPVARRSGGHPEIVGANGVLFDGRHDLLGALGRAAYIDSCTVGKPVSVSDIGQVARQYLSFAESVLRRVRGSQNGKGHSLAWSQRQSLRVSAEAQRYLPAFTRRLCRALPVQGHRLFGDVALLRRADWEPEGTAAWTLNDARTWVKGVHNRLPVFLDSLRHPADQHLYRYTLTGDLKASPLLASSVFVAKIRQMAGLLDDEERQVLGDHILSFQGPDGAISDQQLQRCSVPYRIAPAVWSRNLWNSGAPEGIYAQTRHAFAGMESLSRRPSWPFRAIPATRAQIEAHIHKLDWDKPCSAMGHVSDLVFFMVRHKRWFPDAAPAGIDVLEVVDKAKRAYREANGEWHAPRASIPLSEKIGGAIKMIAVLDDVALESLPNPDGLLDLCLLAVKDGSFCDHDNVIRLLHRCTKLTHYRAEEVQRYLLDMLILYRKYYWPWSGGFSFFPRGANHRYQGFRVSMGMPEPDIQGTALVLEGIMLITEALGISEAPLVSEGDNMPRVSNFGCGAELGGMF